MEIRKAAVIGAGVMGAGIAAQLANAGLEVELLDIVPKSGDDRDIIAKSAIEKMHKTNPAPLMHKRNAKRIRPGNTEDHLDRLGECDFIVEAVIEDIGIKSALYKKVDAARKKGSIVASNTSTIPLRDLVSGQPDAFRRDFVITHFFNPPRYMRLLELVTSSDNDPARTGRLEAFLDEKLGKEVVRCHDTPGFIANRIGTFWLECAVNEAIARDIMIEEADALIGRPMGIPKTGVFGLIDLVGLDLMPHISKSLLGRLPADDAYVRGHETHAVIDKMIADGYTGRKGKGGFYRRDENKNDFAVDLKTGELRPKAKPKNLAAVENSKKGAKRAKKDIDLKALADTDDKYGAYAWAVLRKTLCYAADHAAEIAGSVAAVDAAMKNGYAWKYGPFEMIDDFGVDDFITRLEREGTPVPALLQRAAGRSFYRVHDGKKQFLGVDGAYETLRRPAGVLLLSDIKLRSKPVARNMSASLWDIGEGALCAEFHSKMNALDFFSLRMLNKAMDIIGDGKGRYKALVIHNEGENFSVGANIGVAMYAAKIKQYWLINMMVKQGQDTFKRMKYAPFPIVSAPSGRALGGGCEVLMHSHHVQAHAETYPGLVEVGVGLLPGWGGTTELLCRAAQGQKEGRIGGGPMPPVAAVFETISTAKVGLSAFEAQDLMYLRKTDGITMNKSRLLADAKNKALQMAAGFKPEEPVALELPGPSGRAALALAVEGFYNKGAATPYDVVVSDKVAAVVTGGDGAGPGVKITQDALRLLERRNFMALVRDSRTLKRIEAILKSGKPLREKPEPGKTARELRDSGPAPGGMCCPLSSCANDNEKDTRPKVNWPGKG